MSHDEKGIGGIHSPPWLGDVRHDGIGTLLKVKELKYSLSISGCRRNDRIVLFELDDDIFHRCLIKVVIAQVSLDRQDELSCGVVDSDRETAAGGVVMVLFNGPID